MGEQKAQTFFLRSKDDIETDGMDLEEYFNENVPMVITGMVKYNKVSQLKMKDEGE